MNLNHPEASAAALAILRRGDQFQWYVLPIFVVVLYAYFSELAAKNYRAVAAGLCLYAIHWLYEIGNALIGHWSGHALWTVPTGTAFLLLVGVGVELSLMFALAGLVNAKLLPDDSKAKILGLPAPLAIGLGNAALAAFLEIFLAMTPAFVWVYPWWGALPVFATTYVPFFVVSAYCYYWPPRRQLAVVGALVGVDALALAVFGGALGWI
jgi:hypothetical protein